MTIVGFICWYLGSGLAQSWQNFTTANSGLPSNNIFSIQIEPSGTVWVGSDSGLTAFDGNGWYHYSIREGLAFNRVNDLKIAAGLELWIGTDDGISALTVPSLNSVLFSTPYRMDNTALLSNRVNAVVIDHNLARWFGTDSGVTVFSANRWITSKNPRMVLQYDVLAMDVGPDNVVYCGTEGGGIARLKLSNFDIVSGASPIERPWTPMPIDSVYAISIGEDNVQWFGTSQGLFQHWGIHSQVNWRPFTTADGLPHPRVQAIREDRLGNLWLGTWRGVCCIKKDFSNYRVFTSADGLANDDVRDIAVAEDGAIWFATAGGVSKYAASSNQVAPAKRSIPTSFDQISISPNPCQWSTHIHWQVPHPQYAEIAIYNLRGQRVRILWQGMIATPQHAVEWDGKDDLNRRVVAGIYLVRFSLGEQILHKKMVMMR